MKAKKRILIADDEKYQLKVLEYSLAETGCDLESTTSGEEALARAKSLSIDLLLIDFKLPGIDGIETVRRLKKDPAYAALPVIVLTGSGRDEIGARAMEAGASIFLTKPFSPSELARSVKSLLSL